MGGSLAHDNSYKLNEIYKQVHSGYKIKRGDELTEEVIQMSHKVRP